MKEKKIKSKKDLIFEDEKISEGDFVWCAQEEYKRIYEELSPEDKEEHTPGEALYWVDHIWVFPDGTLEDREHS